MIHSHGRAKKKKRPIRDKQMSKVSSVVHILSEVAANLLVFVSASYKHMTGKIKQQEVYDRTALFGVRFDVSSHSLYGCFSPCFCFEIV